MKKRDAGIINQGQETYAPNWCSLGVVLRVLLICNGFYGLALLWYGSSFFDWLTQFVEAAIWLQPTLFISLLSLCGVRRLAPGKLWVQRSAAAILPASAVVVVYGLLARQLLWVEGEPSLLWFRFVWAGALGLAFQHYFELRARAFSPALVEARLQALQARIRPHFLFNSLNAVLGMMRSDPRRAESTLEDLADLFRELMRERKELVPLANEIALCRRYLAIESLRLGERLQVDWQVSPLPDDILLPSLLLQPLLENAVHHGIEPSATPGTIQIAICSESRRVRIEISNPYLAAHASSGNHMALDNIRARLALLYDIEASLDHAVRDGRYQLTLTIPQRKPTP